MKQKYILRSLKKIPFLCLLGITIVLFDGIYDGILPWPSPFHITLSHPDGSDDVLAMTDYRRQNIRVSNDLAFQTESLTADNPSGEDGADIDLDDSGADDAINDIDANNDTNPDTHGADTDSSDSDTGSGFSDTTPDGGDAEHASDGLISTEHTVPGSGAENGDADTPEPEQTALGEDGLPLVHYMQVEDDYFDDAVFIGDSRTRSLQLYANLEHTTFLADTGLTIYTVLDKKLTPSTMTTKTTVTDYLTNHQFKKIYLMLGINEIGTGTAESFCRSYGEVLNTLRELQPDAIIYLQAILHISESKDKEHTYINNAAIIERNEALQSLVDNEHIFWLDSNPAMCDENGYLIDSYTFDGVHLQAKYVSLWTDYLKQHAIQQDVFPVFQSPFPAPQPQAIS
ncbi:MAG: hypothetical protein K2N41_04910 [Lachnospiraceae bacterium]|nr:hypothetical protein [Lachnospiraceae bacterium]MDE7239033.1 hypothetical protein [Lachnospiraceae bacterium]